MEKGKTVEIDEQKLAEMLDSVSDSVINKGRIFTPFEDAFILAVYKNKKNKEEAAKKIGVAVGTFRRRYVFLKEQGK
jgi:hypothetical protein